MEYNETPRLPVHLLRRRKQYRLRRRVYGVPPLEASAAVEDPTPLLEELAALRTEKAHWAQKASSLQDLLLRARGDLDAFRKRVQRDRDEQRIAMTADLLSRFLPVLDHFDLAVQAAQSASDASAILEGVLMIRRELEETLQALGLRRIEGGGEPFDPKIHEAVATDSIADLPDQAVIETMRPGWCFGERCLRAAMVKVNRLEESPRSPTPAPATSRSSAPTPDPDTEPDLDDIAETPPAAESS